MQSMSQKKGRRLNWLDALRGLTIILMIIYHTCWDLEYLFSHHILWFTDQRGYILERIICFSFILISGYAAGLSHHGIRRGAIVFACGVVVSIVTLVFMPESVIIIGILTFLGSAMIITALLDKGLSHTPAVFGIIISLLLFLLFYRVNSGNLSILGFPIATLSGSLYKNYLTAYLGFPFPGFFSTDYFSILPWIFLYLTGYFIYSLTSDVAKKTAGPIRKWGLLSLLGRYSLEIYLAHQIIIYVVLKILQWGGII